MSILEDILNPFPLFLFTSRVLRQQPYAAPFAASRFCDLISWRLLEEIFIKGHGDCWLPKRGQLPQEPSLSSGYLNLETAQKHFSVGHTVLIRHAERAQEDLARIAFDFYQLFKRPIDIQLYVTPKSEEGFDWHYDVEDVFVFQSQGEKEFRLLANTVTSRPLPMMSKENMQFHLEKKSPEIRCHLKAGDWLYIPAGYWHKAQAITDSFHISVGVLL